MIPRPDVHADRRDRLVNQRQFPHYYVKCSCEVGCHVCAHTCLVTKAHAKHPHLRERM